MGTASEGRLALRYQRPCIAYLDSRSEIPGMPSEVPVEADFARVTAYITAHLPPGAGARC